MQFRRLMVAALGSVFLLSVGVPAFAQRDDHGHYVGHPDFHGHDRDWHRGYAPPPVVVAPPAYGYYTPPPVAVGPAISFGVTIR